MKTRRLRSLYVERKIAILWHMIMSRTCGTGAYMFSTKCHGSLWVIKVRNMYIGYVASNHIGSRAKDK